MVFSCVSDVHHMDLPILAQCFIATWFTLDLGLLVLDKDWKMRFDVECIFLLVWALVVQGTFRTLNIAYVRFKLNLKIRVFIKIWFQIHQKKGTAASQTFCGQ